MGIHSYYSQSPQGMADMSVFDINLQDIDLEFVFTAVYPVFST